MAEVVHELQITAEGHPGKIVGISELTNRFLVQFRSNPRVLILHSDHMEIKGKTLTKYLLDRRWSWSELQLAWSNVLEHLRNGRVDDAAQLFRDKCWLVRTLADFEKAKHDLELEGLKRKKSEAENHIAGLVRKAMRDLADSVYAKQYKLWWPESEYLTLGKR
jgi:hypothetical protein